MPGVTAPGCTGERLTAYGAVTVADGKPRFAGPVRLAGLACGKDMSAGPATLALEVIGDKNLGGAAIRGKLEAGTLAAPGLAAARLTLGGELAFKPAGLRGHVVSEMRGLRTAGLTAGTLGMDGDLDAKAGGETLVFRGGISGAGLARGAASEGALAGAQAAVAGTLAAPLIARLRAALAREERGSRLAGDVVLRREGAKLQVWAARTREAEFAVEGVEQVVLIGGVTVTPAAMDLLLERGIDTVLLPASPEWGFLSSSGVREAAAWGASVDGWVPPHVAEALRDRLGTGRTA
jgi:phosphopantetheine adenylyltransferase